MRIASMPCWMLFSLSGICFFPVESGVDVSNEYEIEIDNITAPYKYINKQEQGKRTFSFEEYLIPIFL